MTFITPQDRHAGRYSPAQGHGQDRAASGTSLEIKHRQDAASYVAAMLTELRQIAHKAGFDRLVTAVDAAYYEAYAAQDGQQAPLHRPGSREDDENVSRPMEQTHG